MAQSEKRENSVLFSLRELRQIEESRVQEEEHAVRSAEEERRLTAEHSIEVVGAKLRSMMPWIGKNKLVDQSRN